MFKNEKSLFCFDFDTSLGSYADLVPKIFLRNFRGITSQSGYTVIPYQSVQGPDTESLGIWPLTWNIISETHVRTIIGIYI